MKKKRVLALLMITLLLVVGLTGCGEKTTDELQADKQAEMLKNSDSSQLPNIVNFQEKKMMKQIMELCDKSDLVCYVYTFSEYTGKYNYFGKSVGFGLPYGTEYTNPQKAEYHSSGGYVTLPQADPNGLFKPADVQATWVCMIDDKTGERYILYNEPNIAISGHKLPEGILNSVPAGYADLK